MPGPSPMREHLHRARQIFLEDLPRAGLAYVLAREDWQSPLLIVAPDDDRAERLVADLGTFGLNGVWLFPAETAVPFGASAPDPRLAFEQFALRHAVLAGQRPPVIVATAVGLQGRWMPSSHFSSATELWVPGEEISQERLSAHFVRCGYNRVNMVEDPGTFAIRGSIVDVFVPGGPYPVRIDLFGDDIASIRQFDPESQRVTGNLEVVAVHPIREVMFDEESAARASDALENLAEEVTVPSRRMRELREEIAGGNYFYGIEGLWPLFYDGGESVLDTLLAPETTVVLDDPDAIERALEDRLSRAERERERASARNDLALPASMLLTAAEEIWATLAGHAQIRSVNLVANRDVEVAKVELERWDSLARELRARRDDSSRGEILDPVVSELNQSFKDRREVFIACSSHGNAQRLRELLFAREIDLPVLDRLPAARSFGEPRRSPRRAIAVADISGGFADAENGVDILTDVEIFGTEPRLGRRRRKRPPKEGLTTLRDLIDGELAIHVDHGIGRYLGLKRLVLDGVDGDYVHLEYAGGDKLYLPIYRLNLLQRYQGPKDARIDKLGGTRWDRAKQRVRDAVLNIAHGLLALQARRKAQPGFALGEPDEHFRSFEATFPHEETPDQQKAIDEVLADLTRDTPMDRLICGDVGFGKTEVAIRAAFLAVLAGKKVMLLVPTTVLAEQHGQTFHERLDPQGVSIEVLSRFRSAKETREILERARSGRLDILIGTHRMLSADVQLSDLGLLIVDEEQRFGVKHKERLKELRSQVHVLTLSATPIPRTLHMAMMGLRDLSLIQTPPLERTSIRTEVTRFDEELVQDAIRREMHRGGQVFFVHNRVQSIAAMAERIQALVPEARLAVAHGQMTGTALEKIMVDFVRREYQVLVCTAIIESGIDIPSANTMLVNRADTFGLAQLHQLRGRIGRGRDRAFAYLLLPRSEKITRDALDRLAVLKRFSDLGAGFQIASQDLDLRGAGDLLGADQSGNVAAVGFELYSELLGEAVEKARGDGPRHEVEPDIRLPVTAVLPESYVQQPMRRLDYYQRMAQADSDEKIFDIYGEIQDLYGRAPDEVAHLAEVMVIRRRLKALGVLGLSAAIRDEQIRIALTFLPEAAVDRVDMSLKVQSQPQRYRLTPSGRLSITVPTMPDTKPIHLLGRIRGELGELMVAP